jgi:glycosyltransferase involved in cell wall biosynthesis
MPAYNEAGNIAAAIDEVVTCVFGTVADAELIVVDDGSRDATAAIAAARAAQDARIRVLRQNNHGHGPALLAGVRAACGDYCLLLDSDRQIALHLFADSWRLAAPHLSVLGVREPRADPPHRRVLSMLLRRVLWMIGVRAADANAPYKLVPRPVLLAAMAIMPPAPRIPSILLTVYLHRRGLPFVEQRVPHCARREGTTTLHAWRLARLCRHAFGELVQFRRALGRLAS